MQPCNWLRSVGIIFDWQAVTTEFLVLGELAVQE